MKENFLSLRQFSFAYEKSSAPQLQVDHLNVQSGDTIALVGRNGSGKSTLLLALAGLLNPQSGTRKTSVSPDKIAIAFQTPCLDKKLTVAENLMLFGKIWRMSRTQIDSALSELNSALHIDELYNRRVQTLSGGQMRRVDLARALLSEPHILFLDEPTSGLDLITQRELWSVLASARRIRPEMAMICASHHAAELKLFERILFLNQGRIQMDARQEALVEILPKETLEINTRHSAESIKNSVFSVTQCVGSVIAHDKLIVHSDDATQTLETIKKQDSLNAAIESMLVRQTQLSDAVWQRLLQFSGQPEPLDAGGAM